MGSEHGVYACVNLRRQRRAAPGRHIDMHQHLLAGSQQHAGLDIVHGVEDMQPLLVGIEQLERKVEPVAEFH